MSQNRYFSIQLAIVVCSQKQKTIIVICDLFNAEVVCTVLHVFFVLFFCYLKVLLLVTGVVSSEVQVLYLSILLPRKVYVVNP